MNTLAAIYQVVSSLIIVIVILASPEDRADADFVFTEFNNDTGLRNHDGYPNFLTTLMIFSRYVVLLGLLTTMFSFSGYEAGGHVAEETKGARKAAPKGSYNRFLG
jgi:amino acid transporter